MNSKQKNRFKDNPFVEDQEGFYIQEIHNKDVLQNVISYCTPYPFYGEKTKVAHEDLTNGVIGIDSEREETKLAGASNSQATAAEQESKDTCTL